MAEFDSILILAIFLQLISTSVNYIGMTIQKKAATKIPKIGPETGYRRSLKNLIINKAWVFGLGLNASSTFFAAGAFALASITIIQPLYGFGLIVLVIFIRFYLKEKITRLDIFGVLFGVIGIVVIGITAKSLPVVSYTDLLDLFLHFRGIIFFAVFLSIALISYIVSEKTKKTTSLIFLVISSAIWTSTQNIFNKAVATAFWNSVNERNWNTFLSLLAPDCEYIYANAKGKQAVLDRFKSVGGMAMDFHQSVDRLTAEEDRVVVETRWSGNHTQDLMGYPPTGTRFEVPMVFIMEFEKGLVKRIKTIFNEPDLYRQLESS